MSGEQRRGWHAESWNSGESQNASIHQRMLQDSMMGNNRDTNHSFGWAQRQESLRQRDLLQQLSNRSEYRDGADPRRHASSEMPAPVYHRPIPIRGGRPVEELSQTADQQGQQPYGQLEIVDRIGPTPAQLAADVAFNRSQNFHPYVQNLFRNEGPYAVCNMTSELNHEFLKMGVPLKFTSRPVGVNDSGLLIDLIDNRNGRSRGTLFLR